MGITLLLHMTNFFVISASIFNNFLRAGAPCHFHSKKHFSRIKFLVFSKTIPWAFSYKIMTSNCLTNKINTKLNQSWFNIFYFYQQIHMKWGYSLFVCAQCEYISYKYNKHGNLKPNTNYECKLLNYIKNI